MLKFRSCTIFDSIHPSCSHIYDVIPNQTSSLTLFGCPVALPFWSNVLFAWAYLDILSQSQIWNQIYPFVMISIFFFLLSASSISNASIGQTITHRRLTSIISMSDICHYSNAFTCKQSLFDLFLQNLKILTKSFVMVLSMIGIFILEKVFFLVCAANFVGWKNTFSTSFRVFVYSYLTFTIEFYSTPYSVFPSEHVDIKVNIKSCPTRSPADLSVFVSLPLQRCQSCFLLRCLPRLKGECGCGPRRPLRVCELFLFIILHSKRVLFDSFS